MDLAGLLRRQPSQDVVQIGMRFMAVQLGGLHQAHDVGGALADEVPLLSDLGLYQ